jgi:hypothetical protein
MHGSFVIARNSLEMEFGWDWGMVGSITEDTYLAMKLAACGVRFKWVGGNMYEQSPFSCLDFAKQRARWFSGLWLCVYTYTLPLWQRVILGIHLVSWSACPALTFLTWFNLLTIFPRSSVFVYTMSIVFAVPFWSYCLGFVMGVRVENLRHGRVEWILMFLCHMSLIPVYTVMETYGVLRGIFDRSTYSSFHIVQKEGQNVARATQQAQEVLKTGVMCDPLIHSEVRDVITDTSCTIYVRDELVYSSLSNSPESFAEISSESGTDIVLLLYHLDKSFTSMHSFDCRLC